MNISLAVVLAWIWMRSANGAESTICLHTGDWKGLKSGNSSLIEVIRILQSCPLNGSFFDASVEIPPHQQRFVTASRVQSQTLQASVTLQRAFTSQKSRCIGYGDQVWDTFDLLVTWILCIKLEKKKKENGWELQSDKIIDGLKILPSLLKKICKIQIKFT